MDRSLTRALVMGAVVVALIGDVAAPAPSRAAQDDRVGLLIADHGEPPEYNELTYWSFRRFFEHLIEMGLIPSWLKAVDAGTVLQDQDCYACDGPAAEPVFVDAWLKVHRGPSVYVPGSDNVPAHYVKPGGPGLGEPDIFEHIGLAVWNEWELMGGRSPNYDQKLVKKRAVIGRLKESFGDGLPVRVGYGIDPRINGRRQGIREALVALINRDRIDRLVVAYHGVGFSDIMQTHMLRHEVEKIVHRLDPSITVTYADPIGVTRHYVDSVVRKVQTEVAQLPSRAPVAIHLSGHGLPTAMCGEYDCGADAYHAFSRALFARTKKAIVRAIDRPGRFGVFHVYGDGATDDDDPDDVADSPLEALDDRRDRGFRYVIDVPYEFDSDSRDTLIVLRRGYGRPIPDWDARFVSRFRYDGMRVEITNSSFGIARKIDALERVIRVALRRARAEEPGHGHH